MTVSAALTQWFTRSNPVFLRFSAIFGLFWSGVSHPEATAPESRADPSFRRAASQSALAPDLRTSSAVIGRSFFIRSAKA